MANTIYEVIVTTNPVFEVEVNNGAKGDIGEGVASGGVVGQYLHKKSSTNYDTEFKTIDSTEVAYGDGNVSEGLDNRYTESEVDVILQDYYTETEVDNLLTPKMNVDGGNSNVDKLTFDLTHSTDTLTEGQMRWNSTDGTLDLQHANATQQVGQELFIKVINKSGASIPNASAVYFDGRLGNRPKIKLAQSNVLATSMVMGITTQDIADDAEGFITSFGYVRQIKTDYVGWTEGATLYVSSTVAGGLTITEPSAPNHSDIIGSVGIVGGLGIGSILVKIERHKDLTDLSDVNGTPLATLGQIPVWHNTEGYFDFDYNINNYVEKVTGKSLVSDTAITDLTDSGDTTLHKHDTMYYTETETNEKLTFSTNKLPEVNAMNSNLLSGNDICILGIGDSLMETSTSWFSNFVKQLGTTYNFNVAHYQYNFNTKDYNAVEMLNTYGQERHIKVVKSNGTRCLAKTEVPFTSTDLDISIRFSMDDWNDGLYKFVLARYQSGNRCWYVAIDGDNKLVFYWSPDGTNLVGHVLTSVATNTDNVPYWYRFTLDSDDGAGHYVVKIYSSTDGATWTLLDTKTGASTTVVYVSNTAYYSLGGSSDQNSGNFAGKFYEVRIRNGINGKNVCPQPISCWKQTQIEPNNASTVEGTPTIYIYNNAISGYNNLNYTTNTDIAVSVPNMVNAFVFSSLSHNDGFEEGLSYLATYKSVIDGLIASISFPSVFIVVQPPKISPAAYISIHKRRCQQHISLALKYGFPVINMYKGFLDSGVALSTLIGTDGVHPTTAGKAYLQALAYRFFGI